MELPIVRCSTCGKAYPVNEGIMDQGKVFCSKECQEAYLSIKIKDKNGPDGI